MTEERRRRFDQMLEDEIHQLPDWVRDLIEESPVIVEDHPSPRLLEEMGMNPRSVILCGLHTGVPLTERSVLSPQMETIHLFREGIVATAGGWHERWNRRGERYGGEDAIRDQIRVTLLHEIGHHFGLDEDDLEALGYG